MVAHLPVVHISLLLLLSFFNYLVVSTVSPILLFLALLAWLLFSLCQILRNFFWKSFPRTKTEIFCKRKKDFIKKKLFYKTQIIHIHLYSLFIPSFCIFLTHYSSALSRSSFPETLLCYALNEVIDVIPFFLSK